MSPESRTLISFLVGFFSLFVFIGVAESVDHRGQNIAHAILIVSVVMALYFAVSQFLLALIAKQGYRAIWPGLKATNLCLLGWFALVLIAEKPKTAIEQGGVLFASGCLGSIAGALGGTRLATMRRAPKANN